MKDLAVLKGACDAVIVDPRLQPIIDPGTHKVLETFCNCGAMRVAHLMGCDELKGLNAEQQYAVMSENKSGLWKKSNDSDAVNWALSGGLAFGAMTAEMLGETHAHIAAVYPSPMQFSGSLNKNVPCVANVGQKNAEEKESLAFPVSKGEPDWFIWNG